MKKILVVSNMYSSKKYPHYGVFVKNTVQCLTANGFDVKLSVLKKCDSKVLKIIKYFVFYLRTIVKGVFGGYDVIYAHYASHTAVPLLIIRALKKIPIVMNVHGNDIVPETDQDKKYLKLSAKIIKNSQVVIAPSGYFKKVLEGKYGVPQEKIVVYASGGVDTRKFHHIDQEESKINMKLEPEVRYIGYVSRIEESKGWDLFLKAMVSIADDKTKLVVVGNGGQDKEFHDLAVKLGLEDYLVKFKLLPQEKLVYIYNALDVLVFPTCRRSESLGLVGLEAMACQTKVVLPDKYGPASYGNLENSFIFQTGDIEDLTRVVRKALDNTDENVVSCARKTALRYDSKKIEKVLADVFRDNF